VYNRLLCKAEKRLNRCQNKVEKRKNALEKALSNTKLPNFVFEGGGWRVILPDNEQNFIFSQISLLKNAITIALPAASPWIYDINH
jgi:hypothetical protein